MKTEPESAKRSAAASSSARVKRFRTTHQRVDYVPGPEAMKAIDTWCAENPSLPKARLIDQLVVAGNAALIASASAAAAKLAAVAAAPRSSPRAFLIHGVVVFEATSPATAQR